MLSRAAEVAVVCGEVPNREGLTLGASVHRALATFLGEGQGHLVRELLVSWTPERRTGKKQTCKENVVSPTGI